jgi:hemolysin activation/secretion protein
VRLNGVRPFTWTLAADALGALSEEPASATSPAIAKRTTVRGWGELRRSFGGTQGATIRLAAGAATSDPLPQMAFRAGGLATVRGFPYGTQQGQGFWSGQLDVSLLKGGGIRPVLFVDAGHAARLGDLFEGDVLVGGGLGLSLYSSLLRTSLIRFDISRQITPVYTKKLRLDLVFQAPR